MPNSFISFRRKKWLSRILFLIIFLPAATLATNAIVILFFPDSWIGESFSGPLMKLFGLSLMVLIFLIDSRLKNRWLRGSWTVMPVVVPILVFAAVFPSERGPLTLDDCQDPDHVEHITQEIHYRRCKGGAVGFRQSSTWFAGEGVPSEKLCSWISSGFPFSEADGVRMGAKSARESFSSFGVCGPRASWKNEPCDKFSLQNLSGSPNLQCYICEKSSTPDVSTATRMGVALAKDCRNIIVFSGRDADYPYAPPSPVSEALQKALKLRSYF